MGLSTFYITINAKMTSLSTNPMLYNCLSNEDTTRKIIVLVWELPYK